MGVRFVVAPYKMGSAGARNLITGLKEKLGYEPEKVDGDYYIKPGDWVINWGNGYFRGNTHNGVTSRNHRIFNPREQIVLCVNKIDFFRCMQRNKKINIPDWTRSYDEALGWLQDKRTVYCRVDTEGRDGKGIVVAETPKQLVEAPLYTIGVPSTDEYRVHVFQHKPIFDLEKVHHHPTKEQNQVRSGKNGWNYHRDVVMPEACHEQAVLVSERLGMDFCAVDIVYDRRTRIATVLEANSAPELGPWTRAAYAKNFIALTK